MRLDGLPSYDRKRKGKIYRHAGTFNSSNSLYENKKEAKKAAEDYISKGCKYFIERNGTVGFVIYVCE